MQHYLVTNPTPSAQPLKSGRLTLQPGASLMLALLPVERLRLHQAGLLTTAVSATEVSLFTAPVPTSTPAGKGKKKAEKALEVLAEVVAEEAPVDKGD